METKQETDENIFAVSLQRESGNINAVRLRHNFVRSGTCEKRNDPYHQQFTRQVTVAVGMRVGDEQRRQIRFVKDEQQQQRGRNSSSEGVTTSVFD
ncbi:hypothetical protein WN944_001047 [Citrus x changshan-huyou]|uniref:Uncharacterized protein n=1 Tax=Citrus x changshan-huyou TaxID=2935761 RepID=A0AAP0MDX7_9ROSI